MVENCIALQMLRIIISISIFISPVIFCENERSGHFESPEIEVYDSPLGEALRVLAIIIGIIAIAGIAGTVQLVVKLKYRPFSRLPQTLNIF